MHRSLWMVWTVGVVTALGLIAMRWGVDQNHRTVALVVDGEEARTLQALTGKSLPVLLAALRQAGATGVAVPAELLRDWVVSGKVKVEHGAKGKGLRVGNGEEGSQLTAPEPKRLDRIGRALAQQFGIHLPSVRRSEAGWNLSLPTLDLLTAQVFVGLDWELADAARQTHLSVVARLPNPIGLTKKGLGFWMNEARFADAAVVLFDGEEVLGYRTMLDDVAEELRKANWQVGILELTSQKGDSVLANKLSDKVVRVHSVSPRELLNYNQPELVDRFVRAVRERNIRLCYVRMPFHLKGEPLDVACGYLEALRDALQRSGFTVGVPSPMPSVTAPPLLWVLVWLGAVSVGVAFLCIFLPLTVSRQWAVAVVVGLLGIALRWVSPIWAAKLGAFGLAVFTPVVALWHGSIQTSHSGARFARTAIGLAICFALLVFGGIMEAALLFDHRFWLKVSEFAGVKLSQILPFLLVLLLSVTQWWDTAGLPLNDRLYVARANFRSLKDAPVRWWQAVGLLLLLIAFTFWLMRMGNVPEVGVPAWEIRFRALLEDLLIARPRFKEFAFGHPALVLAFYFLTGTHLEAKIGQWMMVPAVVGLASVMNTFSHAHTPISVSLLRTAHGLWLGVLFGFLLIALMKRFASARDRRVISALKSP